MGRELRAADYSFYCIRYESDEEQVFTWSVCSGLSSQCPNWGKQIDTTLVYSDSESIFVRMVRND